VQEVEAKGSGRGQGAEVARGAGHHADVDCDFVGRADPSHLAAVEGAQQRRLRPRGKRVDRIQK